MLLGQVGKPHGLGGAFFVSGRDDLLPLAYGEVYLGSAPETARPAKLLESRRQAGRPLIRCTAADSREAAAALTGAWIYGERARTLAQSRGVWLWAELAGVELFGSDGLSLGRIDHVYNAGASDIASVRDGDGRGLDLPLISDYFDLGATLSTRQLTLKVARATFDELWEPQRR